MMNFLGFQYHSGCTAPCMGPTNEYYTLFGGELQLLTLPIAFFALVGIVLYLFLYALLSAKLRKSRILHIHHVLLLALLSLLVAFGVAYFLLYVAIITFNLGVAVY